MGEKSVYGRIKTTLSGAMEKNVGPRDAQTRIVVGLLLIGLAPLQAAGYVPIPLFTSVGAAFAGAVLTVEGITSRCLLYKILGINRCPVDVQSD
jgi:Protein of unknown function (DUF2892).